MQYCKHSEQLDGPLVAGERGLERGGWREGGERGPVGAKDMGGGIHLIGRS